jgi:hypothetical protein
VSGNDAVDSCAARWFGPSFGDLHPELQLLHREGGVLRGEVHVRSGEGLAGALGRRLAGRMGIPVDQAIGFEVRIRHVADAMYWERRFGNGQVVVSSFRPMGRYPQGGWEEQTGAVRLRLGVEIDQGGWQWRLRSVSVLGCPLPRWLFPGVQAFKRIDVEGAYRFGVRFDLFPLGMLLHYEGALRRVGMTAPAG